MRTLYSRFVTVHKSIVHHNSWKQCYARRARVLSNLHTIVDRMQTWAMRYKGAPLHLPKMMKPKAIDLKARIHCQIPNYEELPQLITYLQASHAWVFKSMDVIMRMHTIPSIGTLTEAKSKNQVWLELDMYFDELMCVATSADTIHQCVVVLAALKTMMCMLSYELDRGAKSMYLDATEARARF